MKLTLAAIGVRPRPPFEAMARLYLDRIAELLPGSRKAGSAKSAVDAPLFRSEQALFGALDRERNRTAPLVVLLDERGRQFSSQAFAQWLGRERDQGRQLILFAIGPAGGWSPEARRRAGLLLSLGPMTLAHELARVVLSEQVYRALTILGGHPYHRGASP